MTSNLSIMAEANNSDIDINNLDVFMPIIPLFIITFSFSLARNRQYIVIFR